MSQQLTDTLKALLLERKKETLRKGWGEVPPWVFITGRGTRLDKGNFHRRVWVKLLAKAALRSLRVHDLRHTFASRQKCLTKKGELWPRPAFTTLEAFAMSPSLSGLMCTIFSQQNNRSLLCLG